jgi:hypothetical protein
MTEDTTRKIELVIVGARAWENFAKPAFGHLEQQDPPEWVRFSHAISEKVWKGRPYVPYTTDDVEPVREAFKDFAPNQLKWATETIAPKCDGVIMIQHKVPGLDLLDIPPQLRPHKPIFKGNKCHYHPSDDPPEGYVPTKPNTDKPLDERYCSKAWAKPLHILRDKDEDDHHGARLAKKLGYKKPDDLRRLVTDPACEEDLESVLREANNEMPHCHEDWAKYILTITPRKKWVHDHATDPRYKKPEKLKTHLEKWHPGDFPVGEHAHGNKEIDDNDPCKKPGARIDIHPLAWERFAKAEVIYFCIEGKIKADAILSEILRLEEVGQLQTPASVCSVPSVGQWEAYELTMFAMRDLARKIVVIVCDADGCDNPEVMTQALLLENFLEDPSLGLRAVGIFAPPYEVFEANDKYKGGDDHLIRDYLDNLERLGHKTPRPALAQWGATHAQRKINDKRISRVRVGRDCNTMRGLSLLCGPGGQAQPSAAKIARFIGISPDRVEKALSTLIELGELWVDKPLATARQWRSNDYQDRNESFVERRPTIRIVNPALRASKVPAERLADWLERKTQNSVWEERKKLTTEERNTIALERIAAGIEVIARAKKTPVDEEAVIAEFVAAIDVWEQADAV